MTYRDHRQMRTFSRQGSRDGRLSLVTMLEFWPDYGSGPLRTEDGRSADLRSLGLTGELVEELESWNSEYAEDKIPIDGKGDSAWLGEGRSLLGRTRDALGSDFDVIITEPWWGERADLTAA